MKTNECVYYILFVLGVHIQDDRNVGHVVHIFGRSNHGHLLPFTGFLGIAPSSSVSSPLSSSTPKTWWAYYCSHLFSTQSHPLKSFPSPNLSLKSCLCVSVVIYTPNNHTHRPYMMSPVVPFQAAITTTLAPHCFHIALENSQANFWPFPSMALPVVSVPCCHGIRVSPCLDLWGGGGGYHSIPWLYFLPTPCSPQSVSLSLCPLPSDNFLCTHWNRVHVLLWQAHHLFLPSLGLLLPCGQFTCSHIWWAVFSSECESDYTANFEWPMKIWNKPTSP